MTEEQLRERIVKKAGVVAFFAVFAQADPSHKAKYEQAVAELQELHAWLESITKK